MRPTSSLPKRSSEKAAALIIVLAFVVLLTGLAVAYLSRATTDRQLAHTSFHDTAADLLALSALDTVIGDFKQEIVNFSTPRTVNGITVYTPLAPANMVPQHSGNPSTVPNLVRRSWVDDSNLTFRSLASNVNSAPADPGNPKRGEVTKARWNKHYLIRKANENDDGTEPIADFNAPDWVFVVTGQSPTPGPSPGPSVISAPDSSVIGRYAYAVYDEGGLLDANVAGYPTCGSTGYPPAGSNWVQPGRKGSWPLRICQPCQQTINTGLVIRMLAGFTKWTGS